MSHKQNTPPTILLVEQDDQTRPLLMYNLRHQGFRLIVVLEEEDAIERISGKNACPDVILLNQVKLSIDEFMNMGRRIRRAAGKRCRTPIVVMAERFGVDMEGLDIEVGESEYVTYPEDGQQLLNLLHRLCLV
jgi:DNA-binding response OmpR family regulator